ncbi:hypothetical protein [Cysteiniphilum litorale]|uniref:hypothetical protein n=1 Tax=Cysteiniphilum litorale TaxID=2056700 RepID=UPI003F8811A7
MTHDALILLRFAHLTKKDKRWFKQQLGNRAYRQLYTELKQLPKHLRKQLDEQLIAELAAFTTSSDQETKAISSNNEFSNEPRQLTDACQWFLDGDRLANPEIQLTADCQQLILNLFAEMGGMNELEDKAKQPSFAQLLAKQLYADDSLKQDENTKLYHD